MWHNMNPRDCHHGVSIPGKCHTCNYGHVIRYMGYSLNCWWPIWRNSNGSSCSHTSVPVRIREMVNINTLRPRQNERHFADDIFKCIFLNENIWIPIKISLKFVPKGSLYNIPALVQTMACRLPGDKPLSEPMMVSLLTHICVTRPQWVKMDMLSPWLH